MMLVVKQLMSSFQPALSDERSLAKGLSNE
jgi:hypothetical protein